MKKFSILSLILMIALLSLSSCKTKKLDVNAPKQAPQKYKKVEKLLKKMTLEEKVGQMNQYNGFFDVTGPPPSDGDAAMKYENIKSGLVGSMYME